ncbi:MAG: CYTH domain-containing protein [Bacteroidetes bacterium]|nr:CYTH domain-containing protein [Bacteroidota bacterium]
MPFEIEKKYLVFPQRLEREVPLAEHTFKRIAQGYLASSDLVVVRVRVDQERGYLTIKQRSSGIKRLEIERDISLEEANELLELCTQNKVEKKRYYISYGKHTIELDVFQGANNGLILAEVEFENEEDASAFCPPDWFSDEVSGDLRYYNHYLSEHPYTSW